LALALGALALADLPLLLQALGAALAALIAVRDGSRALRRPQRMRLYADGSVESRQNDAERLQPATLLQATTFLGLNQLHWADADARCHACMVFPDRMDADTRHRLHVWLATHRPSRAPFPVLREPGAPASASQ
jgi:hypothetical protein